MGRSVRLVPRHLDPADIRKILVERGARLDA